MADISFYAGEGSNISNLAGSGLGFYHSDGFGFSIAVGEYQGRTYITDATGANQGPEADNNQYVSSSGVIVGQGGSSILLTALPNYQSTLNIRFTHGTAVKTQNVKLYGGTRSSKNDTPVGVTFQAAEIRHLSESQTPTGSGDAAWTQLQGSGSVLDLVASPGTSGFRPSGSNTEDTRHDWYVAMSASPTSAGSKEFRGWVELEYV